MGGFFTEEDEVQHFLKEIDNYFIDITPEQFEKDLENQNCLDLVEKI